MKSSTVVVVAAALFWAASARAEWHRIASSTTGAEWYLDADRIKVVGGKVQAWVKVDGSADRTVNWRESKRLISFNCAAETYRMLSYVNYDSYGKVISSHSYPDYGYRSRYEPVVPDTVMESVGKLACLYSADSDLP